MQDGVLHILEHMLDVFCVDGCCVVVEEWLAPVSSPAVKHLQQEFLHCCKVVGITCKVWKKVFDVDLGHLLLQEVHLVEKEDDGDTAEGLVVDDRFKNVARLHQAVGLPVFLENLSKDTNSQYPNDHLSGNLLLWSPLSFSPD